MKKCKSRTFQKGVDYQELVDFAIKHLDYELIGDEFEEGAVSDAKYIITITKITEDGKEI